MSQDCTERPFHQQAPLRRLYTPFEQLSPPRSCRIEVSALRNAAVVSCSRELRENCGMFLMAARAIARPLSKRHKRRRTTPTPNEDASSTASTSSTTSVAPSTQEDGASVVRVALLAVPMAASSGDLTICMQTIVDWEHAPYGRALHSHELGDAMRLMLRALRLCETCLYIGQMQCFCPCCRVFRYHMPAVRL